MMAQTTTIEPESLQMLPVNKTVVFCSPLESKEVLVRTGTIGEGSCLFHALLHAYSKDYVTMHRQDRMKFVRRLRASMAGQVTQASWEQLGNGVISMVPFQENVLQLATDFYSYLKKPTDIHKLNRRNTRRLMQKLQAHTDNYEVIPDLLPMSDLFDVCLTTAYKNSEDKNIDDTSKQVLDEIRNHLLEHSDIKQLESERSDYVITLVQNCFSEVLKEAKKSAFRSYVKGLERVSSETDSSTVEFISERFQRDIYFLNGTDRMPYNICSTSKNLKNRKSVVILWINENHYEIVGRLLSGNRIQREFAPDDPFIARIRTVTMNPEAVPRLYPELSTYVPKSVKEQSKPVTPPNSPSNQDCYYDGSSNSDED